MPIPSPHSHTPRHTKAYASSGEIRLNDWADWADRQSDKATLAADRPLAGGKFRLEAKSPRSPAALMRKLSSMWKRLDNDAAQLALSIYTRQVRCLPGLADDVQAGASLEALESLLGAPGGLAPTIHMEDVKQHFRAIADAQKRAALATAQKLDTDNRLAWNDLITAQPPAPDRLDLCAQFPQLFTPAGPAPTLADELASYFAQPGGPTLRPLPDSMKAQAPTGRATDDQPHGAVPVAPAPAHRRLGQALKQYDEMRAINARHMAPRVPKSKGSGQTQDLAYCQAFNAALQDARIGGDGLHFDGSAQADAQHNLQWIDEHVKALAQGPTDLLRAMKDAAARQNHQAVAQLAGEYMHWLDVNVQVLNRLAQHLMSPQHQTDLPNSRQANLRAYGCMLQRLGTQLLQPDGPHAQLYALSQLAASNPQALGAALNAPLGVATAGLNASV